MPDLPTAATRPPGGGRPRAAEAANDTALAGGIPTFKHDQGSLRTAKVSLLYELKYALE